MSLSTSMDLVVFNFDFLHRNNLLTHLRDIVVELSQYGINVALISSFWLVDTISTLQKVEPCFDKLFCNITETRVNVHDTKTRIDFLVDSGFKVDQTLFLNFRSSNVFRNNLHLSESQYYNTQSLVDHLINLTQTEPSNFKDLRFSPIELDSQDGLELVG